MRWLSTTWKRLADASLAQWLWQLLPAGLSGAVLSALAYLWAQPPWVVGLVALAAFALVSWGLAAWRIGRVATVQTERFDDLRARVRDKRMAELLGEEDAERAYRTRIGIASLGLEGAGMIERLGDERRREAELEEARHKGRIRRLENGEEE